VAPAALASGSLLAGFELERVLGRGGMGVVWLAREPGLDRHVAMKVLAPELAADEEFRERFLREMRLAASFDHPHVCPVYRAGEEDGLLYLALRFVPGRTLGEAIENEGSWPPERAFALLGDLAGALDAAHAHGLLHRDVKPENVLLDEQGNAYLADFGLARADSGTRTGTVASLAGTLAYLAPELIEGLPASRASDLYSFACLTFCLLTGTPPFVREHEAALMFAHVREPPPSLAEHDLSVLDPFFARALAKRPEERYANCRELVAALEDALVGVHAGVAGRADHLPRPQTAFVGRERELAHAAELLETGARILTLTGPGGTGKTRLALELAAGAAVGFERVHWLPLAALRDPELIAAEIARELGEPERKPADAIGARKLLLCLDNLEQLLPAAAGTIAELILACPNLTVIATSRAALRVQAEREYPVLPLDEREAVDLFGQRALQQGIEVDADAPVLEICRRLDCLPLAVELAAARLKLLPAEALLARLEQRLPLLSGGPRDAPERQRTLTATLDWSHDLLRPEEQQLFRRLSVFAGGCTLEAAEQVCGADIDTLSALLDASVLRRRDTVDGEARFSMLAVVREYSAAKLAAADEELDVRRAHASRYRELAERAGPELYGATQKEWIELLEAEIDDLRAALAFALEHEPHTAVTIGGSLWRWWQFGYLGEGRAALTAALERVGDVEDAAVAAALLGAGGLARSQGDLEDAERLLERSLAVHERLGDPVGTARTLNNLGNVALSKHDLTTARSRYEATLEAARKTNDLTLRSVALNNLGELARRTDDLPAARRYYEESLFVDRERGDRFGVAQTLHGLGLTLHRLGDSDAAGTALAESLALFGEFQELIGIAWALNAIAVTRAEADAEHAARLLGAADRLFEELGESDTGDADVREALARQLGTAEFERALAAGRTLTLEAAVAQAETSARVR